MYTICTVIYVVVLLTVQSDVQYWTESHVNIKTVHRKYLFNFHTSCYARGLQRGENSECKNCKQHDDNM